MKFIYFVAIISLLATSCDITESNAEPDEVFSSVFDNGKFSDVFYPLDIKQTSDQGFVILAAWKGDSTARPWPRVYLMKASNEGKFMWEQLLDKPYVCPAGNIIQTSGGLYFACMDNVTLGTYLMKIDEAGGKPTVAQTYSDIKYPTSINKLDDGSMLVIGYNRNSRSSTLSKIDASFNITWNRSFGVIEDAEAMMIGHLTRSAREFPFFAGATASGYYANMFYNYSFSLVFTDASGNGTGAANGYRYDGAISSAFSLSGNSFALSRYSYEDNYLVSPKEITPTAISSTEDLDGSKLPELKSKAKVRSLKMQVNGQDAVVIITSTKAGQIVLYVYSSDGSQLIGTKYLGSVNPVEAAGVVQTADGGIVVLGQVYVTGRFPRITMYKIGPEKILELPEE